MKKSIYIQYVGIFLTITSLGYAFYCAFCAISEKNINLTAFILSLMISFCGQIIWRTQNQIIAEEDFLGNDQFHLKEIIDSLQSVKVKLFSILELPLTDTIDQELQELESKYIKPILVHQREIEALFSKDPARRLFFISLSRAERSIKRARSAISDGCTDSVKDILKDAYSVFSDFLK